MAELCHNLLLWVWIRRNAPWKLLRARLGFNVVQIGSSNRIARHFSAIAEHKSKKTHTHTHTITRKKLPEQPVCEERNPGGGETRTAAFWERGRTAKKTHPNRRSKKKQTMMWTMKKVKDCEGMSFFGVPHPFGSLWGVLREGESHSRCSHCLVGWNKVTCLYGPASSIVLGSRIR